jgi:predicted O-methyltransferase YrrM
MSLQLPDDVKYYKKAPRKEELEWLYYNIQELEPKRILEYGTGLTTMAINQALRPERYVVICDEEDKVKKVREYVPNAEFREDWNFDEDTDEFDLVFVDSSSGSGIKGLHRDLAIKAVEPFMAPNCVVVIHDWTHKMGSAAKNYLEQNNWVLEKFTAQHRGFGFYVRPENQESTIAGTDMEYIKDYSGFTVVTACDTNHIWRLEKTLPTWVELKKLDCPILVFAGGIKEDGSYIDKNGETKKTSILKYPNVKIIPWTIAGTETQREKMLSAFVFGVAEHVETEHWIKLDSDTIAVDGQPWLRKWFLNHRMVGQPWSYSKPGSMVPRIDYWLDGLQKMGIVKTFNGADREYIFSDRDKPTHKRKHTAKRVISYIRVTETSLMREIASWCIFGRMPVPSEDTLVWRVCEKLDFRWERNNFKKNGWIHNHKNIAEITEQALSSNNA